MVASHGRCQVDAMQGRTHSCQVIRLRSAGHGQKFKAPCSRACPAGQQGVQGAEKPHFAAAAWGPGWSHRQLIKILFALLLCSIDVLFCGLCGSQAVCSFRNFLHG